MADSTAAHRDAEWEDLTDSLPRPTDPVAADDLLWREFSTQFRWYDRAASRSRRTYRILEYLALVAGAAVTVLAALSAPAPLTAAVGAMVVVVEGIQKIGQFHANWINYRGTAETMRQHGFAYAAAVAPYNDPDTRRETLLQALREAVAKETASWVGAASKATRNSAQ